MEFDDFDEDDEFLSPPPHPDDRLWRHPSEIARELAGASSGGPLGGDDFAAPIAGIDALGNEAQRPILARVAARWPLALAAAGGVVVFATLGMSQLFTVSDSSDVSELAANTRKTTSISTSLGATRGEADWDQTLRDRIEPTLPTLEVFRDNGALAGRAIFISEAGHLMTSAQLVGEAEMIAVKTSDGHRYTAHVIDADPLSDIAVLKINYDETTHPVAHMSLDSLVRTGQPALTIPTDTSGLAITQLTSITASSTLADGSEAYGLLRVGASASSIQAGTAIFDDSGSIIGMVPMINASNAVAAAVPIGFAHQVATELVLGTLDRPWLGAGIAEAASEGSISGSVVEVVELFAGSPADEIGLEVGDRIVSVDGVKVDSISTLLMEVWKYEPGSEIELGVLRKFEHSSKRVVLGERPAFVDAEVVPSS